MTLTLGKKIERCKKLSPIDCTEDIHKPGEKVKVTEVNGLRLRDSVACSKIKEGQVR